MTTYAFPVDAFPLVVGHRGSPATHPENTIASFEAAIAAGVRAVELDVRLTRDRSLVVMHDPTVDRTTDGTGAVHELTVDEIRALDAGGGERVPLLTEVLGILSGRSGVAIEVKNLPGEPSYDPHDEPIVDAVHAALSATSFDGPALVLSFNPKSIAASRAVAAEIPTGFLATTLVPPDDALAHVIEAGHPFVLPGTRSLDPAGAAFVDRAHRAGVRVGTWTVDRPAHVERYLSMGVDVIASNDPAMAVEVVRRR